MSDDTIKRADALNALLRMDGTSIDKALAMGEIRSIPSAYRPMGVWIHDYHFGLALPEHKCSVCGEWEYSDRESNFCPNCGARMKGATDGNK